MRPLPIASLPSGNQLVGKGCALRLFIDHKITGYFCPGQEIISQRPTLVNPFSPQFPKSLNPIFAPDHPTSRPAGRPSRFWTTPSPYGKITAVAAEPLHGEGILYRAEANSSGQSCISAFKPIALACFSKAIDVTLHRSLLWKQLGNMPPPGHKIWSTVPAKLNILSITRSGSHRSSR